jgi:hypothetical protein
MTHSSGSSEFGAAERLQAESSCVRLVYEFGRLVDARNFEELVKLFDDDGEFNRPSEPNNVIKGRAALLANFRTRPNYVSAHLFSNVNVSVDSSVRAVGHSYLVMYTANPGKVGSLGVPIANPEARIGAFTEEFICKGGVWRFSRRVGRMLMVVELSQEASRL